MPNSFHKDLQFYINGQKHIIQNPDPSVLLVDYLRSTEVGLTGTKHACGQGGCGSCTVMLSYWDEVQNKTVNVSCNSCLRPLVALDGMEVTTIEGLGSVNTEVSPVQYSIAKNNGTQCGYCTPGFVMNMHSLLIEKSDEELTKKEIEQSFDGNICRCTGFRPILYAMKTFASDWSPADEIGTPPCVIDPAENVKHYEFERGIDENDLNKNPRSLYFSKDGLQWFRPTELSEVHDLLAEFTDTSVVKLVCGNTSVGIPSINPQNPQIMIDISQINDLKGIDITDSMISVGAATTYTEFLDVLESQIESTNSTELQGLKALHYMAIRTAGKIVRNIASLAGNTMLVARNIESGYPFPSDLFVALASLDTTLSVSLQGGVENIHILDFIHRYNVDKAFAQQAVIAAYHIPKTTTGEYAQTYKTALRLENSHSLCNAGFKVCLDSNNVVKSANLVIGGIRTSPTKASKTESFLIGKVFSNAILNETLGVLTNEVNSWIESLPQWYKNLPTEGVGDNYKLLLAQSYLYKFFVEILKEISPSEIPAEVASAPQNEFDRPVSKGSQHYSTYKGEAPVNLPIIRLSAFEQATGEAIYTHDIPVPVKGLQGAFVTSTRTLAKFHYHIPLGNGKFRHGDIDDVIAHLKEKFEGVVDYITYRDIPAGGANGSSDPYAPDPYFCVDEVTCYGQCIGLVIATEEQTAIKAADYLGSQCISYAESTPILSIMEALQAGDIFPGYNESTDDNQKITNPNSNIDWIVKSGISGLESGIQYATTTLDGEACLIVAGKQHTGDQIHFYMESQSCFSQPAEFKQMIVSPSSQSPDSIQSDIARTLMIGENNVNVDIKKLGGGYGGKTTRTPYVAVPTTLASQKLRRPVRVAMPRDNDSYMIGKRHPFLGEYNIAIASDGKILGTVFEFYSNGGNTKDCSFDVMDCAVLGSDNAYNVPNFQSQGFVCKTNRSSNGAMRSYGGVQAGLITEEAIEAAAYKIGMLPEDVRERNLYSLGDKTPYGQQLDYCYIKDVWKRLRQTSDFDNRAKAVEAFNKANKWKKRGISMIPLKYGLGYNLGFLMQGGALIDVYASDGSVLVSHGGVEMGQGVMTKLAQIAAETLNIPLKLIQMTGTRTSVIPNAIGTGATSSSDLNGGAVQKAAEKQRKKLEALALKLLQQNGSAWCAANGINYWDYPNGWQAVVTANNKTGMIWNNIVSQAYMHRVDLSSQALYSTPGLSDLQDQQFYGFTYSACCSEVEIDVLTGESNILRTDMLYDMGKSLNPAIDIGQIEGAFVMGVGNVTTEKVVWEPVGTANPAGMLNTPNTWTYKPPCAASIPLDFRVDLFPREAASEVPENPNLLMSSKGVGEPPLVLANTVFFAIKHAVLAARQDRGLTDWFEMESPATVDNIRNLCAVNVQDLTI
ncbi:MAG: molybdopterin cofactor-binding domain-containing protein [Spirosomataceae bacterium]